MVPAGCSRRLVSILNRALEDCAEQRRKLGYSLNQCQALLGDWKIHAPESPKLEASTKSEENEPSPKELEELELLTRALEKVLRVRKSVLQTPLRTVGAAEGEKTSDKKPAAKASITEQVPVSKESIPKTIKVTSLSKPVTSKKPSAYVLKAPYRTDLDVKRSHRKAPAQQSSRIPRAAVKGSTKGTSSQQAKTNVPVMGRKVIYAAAGSQQACGSPRSPLCKEQSFAFGDSTSHENSGAANFHLVNPEKNCPGSLAESLVTQNPMAGDIPERSPTPQTCTLWEKGSLLKLPPLYRKTYSRNSRLWETCCLCQTSATAAATRNHFVERIQTTFCPSTPTISPAEIEEEVNALHDAYTLLSHHFKAENTGHTTWQSEYECLLTLEGLQTTVSQCLNKLQQLRRAAESQERLQACCTGGAGCPSADCTPFRGRRCGNMSVLAVPLLYYSSLQELRDITALKLQVAMLWQKINVQKVMITELLPVLEYRIHHKDSVSHLYRAVYTLLCEDGERFPVLVNDELSD
ncbi:PREDICTED: uncharacterized protein C16orf59 homolog isoform X2 [Gavialis gangeticus]|uniref:uncharacterized protein C16orf59 homolog isoform X2 n=1 Tax=Gavialis gangeticus TaxID=94835 RepID=UPI00092F05E7|nr:PREDICTED: uncharacterized protein C16orf59 homolog isoform X2 [Gavialis gangeticus]